MFFLGSVFKVWEVCCHAGHLWDTCAHLCSWKLILNQTPEYAVGRRRVESLLLICKGTVTLLNSKCPRLDTVMGGMNVE